jgi:hypothetical protein
MGAVMVGAGYTAAVSLRDQVPGDGISDRTSTEP